MIRTIAIWITGLIATGIFGAMIGDALIDRGGIVGLAGGVCLFICARLWFGPPPDQNT